LRKIPEPKAKNQISVQAFYLVITAPTTGNTEEGVQR
jgi:hypothetical protein